MSLVTNYSLLRKIAIKPSEVFSNALEIINKGGYQIALVIDSGNKLLGVITDSDIRKALINGHDLKSPVIDIMNSNPLVVSPKTSEAEAMNLMLSKHYFHVPVVDENQYLKGLHVASQYKDNLIRKHPFVVMAGGRGKRLRPLTDKLPKPMLPVGGKPILESILRKAKDEGFQNIILSVNYLAEKIVEYFGDGSRFGLNIEYMYEGKPLGTAGSLSNLPEQFKSDYVFLTNADILTDLSYGEMLDIAIKKQVDGLMATRVQDWQNPFGVVNTKGTNITSIVEKPIYRHQVNAGIYVLSKRLLGLVKENCFYDMPDLFNDGLETKLDLEIYPLHESWIDIGRPSDYENVLSKEK